MGHGTGYMGRWYMGRWYMGHELGYFFLHYSYIRHLSGISHIYLVYISCISHANLWFIPGISQVYLRLISGISKELIRHMSGISHENISYISWIFSVLFTWNSSVRNQIASQHLHRICACFLMEVLGKVNCFGKISANGRGGDNHCPGRKLIFHRKIKLFQCL